MKIEDKQSETALFNSQNYRLNDVMLSFRKLQHFSSVQFIRYCLTNKQPVIQTKIEIENIS